MDHYGRTLSPSLALKTAPSIVKSAVTKKTPASVALNTRTLAVARSAMGTEAVRNLTDTINQGGFDPERGIDQFSALEQSVLREAYSSGNFDNLSGNLKAFVDYQVAKKSEEFGTSIEGNAQMLQEMAEKEQQAQQQRELERQQAIKAQQTKQMIIYGVVGLGGLGLLYYVSKR